MEGEQVQARDALVAFLGIKSKISSTLRVRVYCCFVEVLSHIYSFQVGIEQLFNQLIRPRLRTFINDIYKDVTYVLDEESYAIAEYNDTVRKRFIKTWDSLLDGYKVGALFEHHTY
jgi:hypothetical protein